MIEERGNPAARLEGKVALIVGGGQIPGETIGNGRATAQLFGHHVRISGSQAPNAALVLLGFDRHHGLSDGAEGLEDGQVDTDAGTTGGVKTSNRAQHPVVRPMHRVGVASAGSRTAPRERPHGRIA